MTTATKATRLYEIMVIYDPADASKDWDVLVKSLSDRIEKLDGSIIRMLQWADNRKLAYELKGLRRGTYLSGYFRMPPGNLDQLDRNLRLDERVIRHLVISHRRQPPDLVIKGSEKDPEVIKKAAEQAAEKAESTEAKE